MPWCPSPGASCPTYRCMKARTSSEASRPVEGHRDIAGPWLRQITLAVRHSPQCLFQPSRFAPFVCLVYYIQLSQTLEFALISTLVSKKPNPSR